MVDDHECEFEPEDRPCEGCGQPAIRLVFDEDLQQLLCSRCEQRIEKAMADGLGEVAEPVP